MQLALRRLTNAIGQEFSKIYHLFVVHSLNFHLLLGELWEAMHPLVEVVSSGLSFKWDDVASERPSAFESGLDSFVRAWARANS